MDEWIHEITHENADGWSSFDRPADFVMPFDWSDVLSAAEDCAKYGTVVLAAPERFGMEKAALSMQNCRVGLKKEKSGSCIMLGTEEVFPLLVQAQNIHAAVIDLCGACWAEKMAELPDETLKYCVDHMRKLSGTALLLLCDDASYPYALLHYAVAKQCGVNAMMALLHPYAVSSETLLKRRCEIIVKYVLNQLNRNKGEN